MMVDLDGITTGDEGGCWFLLVSRGSPPPLRPKPRLPGVQILYPHGIFVLKAPR